MLLCLKFIGLPVRPIVGNESMTDMYVHQVFLVHLASFQASDRTVSLGWMGSCDSSWLMRCDYTRHKFTCLEYLTDYLRNP